MLKVNISKALKRLKKRKIKNRYDKFSRSFYNRVQKSFIKISKTNTKKYILLDSSKDDNVLEKIIYDKVVKKLRR